MKYLIYISSAVKLMSDSELADLLEKSRENNKAHNLTGILLYSQGTFMQVLEGDGAQLSETYATIEQDPRHKSLFIIDEGDLKERNFGEWSMAFRSVQAKQFAEIQGYFNPENRGKLDAHLSGNHSSIDALKAFLDSNPT